MFYLLFAVALPVLGTSATTAGGPVVYEKYDLLRSSPEHHLRGFLLEMVAISAVLLGPCASV